MALAAVVIVIAAANIAIVMLAAPAADILQRAPEIGAAFKEKLHIFDGPCSRGSIAGRARPRARQGGRRQPRLSKACSLVVTPAAVQFVLQLVLFFGTLFFFILGRATFRQSAVNWFSAREARLRALKILNDIEDNLSGYLIVVTAINLSLGVGDCRR